MEAGIFGYDSDEEVDCWGWGVEKFLPWDYSPCSAWTPPSTEPT